MVMPGFAAEASIGRAGATYRTVNRGSYGQGVYPAQTDLFCGICALQGFGCGEECKPCGPWGLFTCCNSTCTSPHVAGTKSPLKVLKA